MQNADGEENSPSKQEAPKASCKASEDVCEPCEEAQQSDDGPHG